MREESAEHDVGDRAPPAPPATLAREAWTLDPPSPHEIPHILRDEAGLLLDRLLTRVASPSARGSPRSR